MPKSRIQLPERFRFYAEVPIRITDLNYGGHVGNDTVVAIMHEGRIQFLQSLGYANELDAIDGQGLILTDLHVEYKAEIFYGDVIRVGIAPAELSDYGCGLIYRLARRDDDTAVALAYSSLYGFDYRQRRIARLPAEFRRQLGSA